MNTAFRKLGDTPNDVIRKAFDNPLSPLIIIDEWDGITSYVNKTSDKVLALKNKTEWQTFLFPWLWKYKTDVFELEEKDILLLSE